MLTKKEFQEATLIASELEKLEEVIKRLDRWGESFICIADTVKDEETPNGESYVVNRALLYSNFNMLSELQEIAVQKLNKRKASLEEGLSTYVDRDNKDDN